MAADLRVRDLPMADQNKVNNLFVDMLGVNARLRGKRRMLAVELANLCASRDTLLECLLPSGDKPSQYLLPVRASVLAIPKFSTLMSRAIRMLRNRENKAADAFPIVKTRPLLIIGFRGQQYRF